MESIFNNGMITDFRSNAEINIKLLGNKIISGSVQGVCSNISIPPGKVVLPGFSQLRSIIRFGGARSVIILVSRNRPGWLLINITSRGLYEVSGGTFMGVSTEGVKVSKPVLIRFYQIHTGIIQQCSFWLCHINISGIFKQHGHIHQAVLRKLSIMPAQIIPFMGAQKSHPARA
jgi:hypothetical protein